jgi:PAS domain-containing protein
VARLKPQGDKSNSDGNNFGNKHAASDSEGTRAAKRPEGGTSWIIVRLCFARKSEMSNSWTSTKPNLLRACRDGLDFKDFFESSNVPLHLVSDDGTILQANKAELELLGYQADEYIGRHIADFYVERSKVTSPAAFSRA